MPTDRSWKTSYRAIWIAELVAIAGFATTAPIIPLHFRSMGVVDAAALNFWTGLTQSVTALALALMAPVWGALADAYGRKLMLQRAMFGGAVLIGLMSLATEPWHIFALRALQGAVTGTVAAATVLTAGIVPKEEAGYRLGLIQTAVYLGNSIGPLFGGFVSDAIGTRWNFVATGLILSAAGLLITRSVRDTYVPPERAKPFAFRDAAPDFSILTRSPILLSLMAVVFAVQFATAVVQPILPLIVLDYAGDVPGVASLSGLVIGAGSVAGAIAAALIGRVSGRLGYGRTLVFCTLGAFAFYLPQGLVRDPWSLLGLRLGSGIFLGGTIPSVNALIASVCDRHRQGATYGLSASIASIGMALGPAVGASVATVAGRPAVFFVTSAVLAAVGATVALALRRGAVGIKSEAVVEALEGGAS